MPTSTRRADLLVDTSVAIALVVADHAHHDTTYRAIGSRRLGLAGHAAFETFSVLTRLPPPARRTPASAARVITANFPATRFLSARATADLLSRLSSEGMTGGAVYDALVGATAVGVCTAAILSGPGVFGRLAREIGEWLDRHGYRSLDTYRALGVDIEVIRP